MNGTSQSLIHYAALRTTLRGIALVALLASRNVRAQPAPGGDENVLPDDAKAEPAAPAANPDEPPAEATRELPRKAKRQPPAPKPALRSRARVEAEEREAPLQPGAVRVHLETTVPAALYDIGTAKVPSGAQPPDSQLVCHSPCDAQVDVSNDQVFAVWAPNLEMSKPFTIDEDARNVVVSFEPPPSTLNDVGMTIGIVGLAFFVLGGSVFLYGAEHGDVSDDVLAGAGVTLGGGAALMLIGTPMMLAARHPELTVEEKPRGEAFAIDRRPKAVAPRLWLGEF